MSIIEKAVDKLGAQAEPRLPAEPTLEERVTAVAEELVEEPIASTAETVDSPAKAASATAGTVGVPQERAPQINEVSEETGASFIARERIQLDLEGLARRGIVTPETSTSLLSEQFRVIKRPIVMQSALAAKDASAVNNVTMVASALPGEGKTATSISLAMSIAMERDGRVLLIDADPQKRDASRHLGCVSEPGLMDYLSDPKLTLFDVMLSTNVDKLFVVPAGMRGPHVTELLASQRMRGLLQALSRDHPDLLIVLDSPPLLSVAGAKVLTTLVGQVVMVVEAVRTPQSAVTEALEIIGTGPRVGFVLNKSRYGSRIGYGYDYGYGYGYGYGYEPSDAKQ